MAGLVVLVILIVILVGVFSRSKKESTESSAESIINDISTVEEIESTVEIEETSSEVMTVQNEEQKEQSKEAPIEEAKEEPKNEYQPPVNPAASVTPATGGHIVAIDAGHQGRGNSEPEPIGPGASQTKAKVTSGASGVSTGIPEYQLNLDVSLMLKSELVARGYQVVMIRESNDVNLSNSERAAIANQSGAEIFLRIHANSSTNGNANGILTMCMTPSNPYVSYLYNSSRALSDAVLNNMVEMTGAKRCGVSEVDNMSGINWCTIPVTIVEMGFMSNVAEANNMAPESYRNLLVKGMANGIDEYFGY